MKGKSKKGTKGQDKGIKAGSRILDPLIPRSLDPSLRFEIAPDRLCWHCTLDNLTFDTTDDITVSSEIVGQRRAVDALNTALEIESVGYNVFVSGRVGTGRTTTVRKLLESTKTRPRELDDKCYVNNFRDPYQPRLLRLPAGKGQEFRRCMDEFIEYLVKNVPLLFESDTYQQRRQGIVDGFKERGGIRVREFEKRVATEGFALVQTGPFNRPELAPIVEKQPVKIDALPAQVEEGKLTAARAEEIKARYAELAAELAVIFKDIRDLEKAARDTLAELDQSILRPVVEERLADIEERCNHRMREHAAKGTKNPGPAHSKSSPFTDYLAEVKDAILAQPDVFRQKPPAEGEAATSAAPQPGGPDPYPDFRVNVLVDNSNIKAAPVIFETNPNYKNLFGSIDRVWDRGGQWRADFTRIKPARCCARTTGSSS